MLRKVMDWLRSFAAKEETSTPGADTVTQLIARHNLNFLWQFAKESFEGIPSLVALSPAGERLHDILTMNEDSLAQEGMKDLLNDFREEPWEKIQEGMKAGGVQVVWSEYEVTPAKEVLCISAIGEAIAKFLQAMDAFKDEGLVTMNHSDKDKPSVVISPYWVSSLFLARDLASSMMRELLIIRLIMFQSSPHFIREVQRLEQRGYTTAYGGQRTILEGTAQDKRPITRYWAIMVPTLNYGKDSIHGHDA